MMGDPMVLSESETVKLKMSAEMISKNCAKIVQKQECVGSGIKKSFYIETTRLDKIAQD